MDKIFYILSFLTLLSASLVIISKHPIRSILFLIITFFLISGHYILLNAQFLALVNIVVYAGAIMVLFLFVVMFLNLNQEIERFKAWLPITAAVISCGLMFIVILSAYKSSEAISFENPGIYNIGLVEQIGDSLYRNYLLPMEICSLLFIVAMIGVVLLNRKESLETNINKTA
jgi:NADH-quinone oxidoreductase subunit J